MCLAFLMSLLGYSMCLEGDAMLKSKSNACPGVHADRHLYSSMPTDSRGIMA